ncbi:SIMPL domain-containing protein [Flavobacterium sp. I3-2]|uniref:SIMPL domain-containing protein n=1 Tax=Flavobacterium sp. I3-2 TaxID=2748319 RepID=UPI0015AC6878|nr:SIMPL domain-containing protein [Flavobacterium sp. I3-2]
MKKIFFLATVIIACATTQAQNTIQEPVIVVSGEGSVKVKPDEAILTIGSEIKGKDASVVKLENDKIISKMIAFLKKNKIAEKDFQSQNISLNRQYDYETKTEYFLATQILTIQLKDLSKYENIMFGLIEAGANTIQGVEFKSSKTASFETEARSKAVANAKNKATDYGKALNQPVGQAIYLSEFSQVVNPRIYNMEAKLMSADASGGQTAAPGEIVITSNITVHYQLGK